MGAGLVMAARVASSVPGRLSASVLRGRSPASLLPLAGHVWGSHFVAVEVC